MTLKNYAKYLMGSSREYESHLENIFRLSSKSLKQFKPANLLDVGCGDGNRTLLLAQHFHIPPGRTFGVEFYEPHIRKARENFHTSQIDLETDPLPYDDGTFDLVICNQVLEHLKNYQDVLEQMIRTTKSGGYIILGIPNMAHLINRFLLIFGIQPMCIDLYSSHVRGFTHKAFKQMLRSTSGVSYIACTGSNLIYPLPLFLAKPVSRLCVDICAYTCYLVRKS